jgi:8-oxo-dGTP diphosphatase
MCFTFLEEYRLLVGCLRIGCVRVIEFGERIKGISYIDRPGAYAIIQDGSNAIALVRTPQGYLLPGGGVEPTEDFEGALQREIMEELGHESRIEGKLCTAVQYLYSEAEHEYFKKVGHFFRASLMKRICEPTERNHELMWCSCDASVEKLAQEFQAWAVRQAFKMTPQRSGCPPLPAHRKIRLAVSSRRGTVLVWCKEKPQKHARAVDRRKPGIFIWRGCAPHCSVGPTPS